ncbi:MAG: rod shape-determining protein MreC [Firmicutes bacterium]|nr:rod shape-determining protein MreC [Bacillota bacterium]
MRFFYKKAAIISAAVLTVILLTVFSARETQKFPLFEKTVVTILAPLEYAAAKTGYGFRQIGVFFGNLSSVYRDNETLRAQNEQLRQNELNVTEMMAENARLRALLDYKKASPQFTMVTVAVIGRDPGNWTNTIVINGGSNEGIRKDMAVVTPQGLVGSVVQVNASLAKVQLILDPRSAVGVLVQRPESRVAGIVEGNGAQPMAPRMKNLARDADVITGDKIITSGLGGIYPKGLFVGEVIDVVDDAGGLLKYAVLKPAVDFGRLEEVAVIIHSSDPAAAGLKGDFP